MSSLAVLPSPTYVALMTTPTTSFATTLTSIPSVSSSSAGCTILCICNGLPPFCPLPTPLPYTKTTTVVVTASRASTLLNPMTLNAQVDPV
ncbi:hypothetical protein K458DRAFT_390976 [Lentithecium fluviatile CBS 122367]|uniref:Uncharacterized protein n=1 Tax=Lentithecium fluviatile CBS 122367 TaxID=1168545 RepID=A0A6G1IWY0_9PLEO|nr:hypothetical protein K458DRAFT_390976 [Lentithecium fluviatile CBS 122367]